LPAIKPGILSPADMFGNSSSEPKRNHRLNVLYARNYSVLTDAEILLKGVRKLDK
jgi:lipopolysaccharide/colanic/teichoic acid biosynthesis glycosyltransferase